MSESFLPIAIRAWTKLQGSRGGRPPGQTLEPSNWVLVFDTETSVDAGQRLRVGCFRLLRDGELFREALFYETLSEKERRLLEDYAEQHGLPVLTVNELRELFYDVAVQLRATVVGFNLPFDLARLAIDWKQAKYRFAGGFSLIFWRNPDGSENKDRPRLRIKALDNGCAMYEFTRQRKDPRTHRRPAHWPGRFLDVSTLTQALTGDVHSLASASRTFRTRHKKPGDIEHGKPLTRSYLRYLRRDVLVTEELLEKLLAEYSRHPIDLDPCQAYSGASVAKAYLKAFGIAPPLKRSSCSDEELGQAMAAFFGGRAEIHIRRELVPVTYLDLESTYPTLFTLQELTRFLRAREIRAEDATEQVRRFVREAEPADLMYPENWPRLAVIVELEAVDDILPVRTAYGRAQPEAEEDSVEALEADQQPATQNKTRSIGVNRLSTPRTTVHYPLADVMASKFLSGRIPVIKQATAYIAEGVQEGLKPERLRGEVEIDPREGELFKQVVEARQRVRRDLRVPELEREARQRSLKQFSNSGSYGIFAQFTRRAPGKVKPVELFCDRSFEAELPAPEVPGPYCFPPLAAFSTAAARLLLALLEHFVTQAGGTWLCTDTDSMAIVTDYEELEPREELQRIIGRPDALALPVVEEIVERFRNLWPYEGKGNLLKLEKENFDRETGERRPLYGIAIASKRYALLNFDEHGNPIVLKRSEHGLGLYASPYGTDDKKKRWIDELWENIVDELLGRAPKTRPWHDLPVIGRVPATTWELLDSFESYNRQHPEAPVRPFNFVSAAYLKPLTRAKPVRLFAPFVSEPGKAHQAEWYEHDSGVRVEITTEDPMGELVDGIVPVKTYGELARQYAGHPEVKFADAQGERCAPTTSGTLSRRHVIAIRSEPYGKEGHALRRRIEGAGIGDRAQETFLDPADFERLVLPVARVMPRREFAEAVGMSERGLRKILNGYSGGTVATRASICALAALWAARQLNRRPSASQTDDCAAWLAAQSRGYLAGDGPFRPQ
ncbi:MAG: hypothetical protein M3198_14835 [Actinomycetota bacterium]|nr:hypothetical protein [Actinomycetota bacterium]